MPRNNNFKYEEEYEEPNKFNDFMSGISKIFGKNDSEEYDDDYEEEEDDERSYNHPTRVTKVTATRRTVSVWKEARTMDDAQLIADGLKEGKEQIVNFEKADPNTVKDIRFFLCGVTYALNGTATSISHDVMMFTPSSYQIEEGKSYKRKSNIFEPKL